MKQLAPLPFDGAISDYVANEAPKPVRNLVGKDIAKVILDDSYPYNTRMDRKEYEEILYKLQIELAKFQNWIETSGARVVVLFEGRDAAGKGGTIKRFRENLNPRTANLVALPKPTDAETTQWYFQRYIAHLPSAGHATLFDRSWYNRAVVERVFGFSTADQIELFFQQVPGFERALLQDGIHLVKLWLNVGRAEQLRRFLQRESDALKQWKLSQIDVDGLRRWDAYTQAIRVMFERTHSLETPWTVIRADDKRRARIAAIRAVLAEIPYSGRDSNVVCLPDHKICGGPDLWNA